jgi:hypothetical protein
MLRRVGKSCRFPGKNGSFFPPFPTSDAVLGRVSWFPRLPHLGSKLRLVKKIDVGEGGPRRAKAVFGRFKWAEAGGFDALSRAAARLRPDTPASISIPDFISSWLPYCHVVKAHTPPPVHGMLSTPSGRPPRPTTRILAQYFPVSNPTATLIITSRFNLPIASLGSNTTSRSFRVFQQSEGADMTSLRRMAAMRTANGHLEKSPQSMLFYETTCEELARSISAGIPFADLCQRPRFFCVQ